MSKPIRKLEEMSEETPSDADEESQRSKQPKTTEEVSELTADKMMEELNTKVSDLSDKLLRKAAEFENYRKRMDNEVSSYVKYANEKLIIDLLPILDDFERLNKSWDEKHDADKYKEGIDLINEKLKKVLQKHGLKEMESLGKAFDVNLHDALLQVPKEDVKPDTVVEEVEKGYFLKDKVIRHAKVIVSSKPERPE
jgi:molecular chaperone GrpE